LNPSLASSPTTTELTASSKLYSLVTGASKGIGRAFADACAAEGRNLALVSLPGEDLAQVADEIRRANNVDVRFLEIDLSQADSAQKVFDWCQTEGLRVSLIVNNAGFGTVGSLLDSNLPMHFSMLHVNMLTPYMLIKLFLPSMTEIPNSGILNIASQAALLPIPFKSTYSATKAFILFLSLSMEYELRGTNVHVGVVAPCGVPTNAAVRKRIASAGLAGRLTMVEAEDVATYSLKCLKRRKRLIIPGIVNRISYFLSGMVPQALNMHFAATQVRKDLRR
jgi:short-subunit dehydrogenase